MPHHYPAGVTCQPARRFRGNACALLEDGLSRLIRVLEHRRVDVDHHLVTLARCPWVELMVKRGLGDQRQRVRLILREGRRIFEPFVRIDAAAPRIELLSGRLQRPKQQRADSSSNLPRNVTVPSSS